MTTSPIAEDALPRTVRDATFDVLRRRDMTAIHSNPGSTEIPFLTGLPADLEFVLGLHEGAVVSMAAGYALGRRSPSFVLLHTAAGLGNAVNAIATARVNRAPLVIVVGQQDRRHLASEPFLAGKLSGLAGTYPVWTCEPARARDVPGAIDRAWHEASTHHGPALVIVPMDDWLAAAGAEHELASPDRLLRAQRCDDSAVGVLATLLEEATAPALVAGAGIDTREGWDALTALAERLRAPVFQESFTGQAGFPQDHPLFSGHLPADRVRLRALLAPHDLVLAVGAPVFRQYPFNEGPFVEAGTRLAVLSDDPDEAHRSRAELAVVAAPAPVCRLLAERLPQSEGPQPPPFRRPDPLPLPGAGEPLRAGHVFTALAERLPRDTVLVEECPSNRPELEKRLPAREPLGFVSAAMGGLGFAIPAAAGLRRALPERPVVAIVGDGSALFGIHGLWAAGRYAAGVLYVVLQNGGYRVMDRLAERQGGDSAWPTFEAVDLATIARGFGCPARRIATHAELTSALDEVVPGLAGRQEPLLLEVVIEPEREFQP